jgi:import inner membrane translocase subunit TIM50
MSAFSVIDNIDTKQRIMYRLFRDCTKYVNGHHVKDLNRLNRDLSKVIFIDFDPQSAKYNPENMLRLPKWDGDMNDTSLVDLAELLKSALFRIDFNNPAKKIG